MLIDLCCSVYISACYSLLTSVQHGRHVDTVLYCVRRKKRRSDDVGDTAVIGQVETFPVSLSDDSKDVDNGTYQELSAVSGDNPDDHLYIDLTPNDSHTYEQLNNSDNR